MMAFLSGWVGEAAKVVAGAALDTWGSKKGSSGGGAPGTVDTAPKQRLKGERMAFDKPETPTQSKAARVEDPNEYVDLWMRRMAQFSQASK
jgi:hypothetical protein